MNPNHPTPWPATTEQHNWIRLLREETREQLILPPTHEAAEQEIERLIRIFEANKETPLRCS
jgi:hypothetical protein